MRDNFKKFCDMIKANPVRAHISSISKQILEQYFLKLLQIIKEIIPKKIYVMR